LTNSAIANNTVSIVITGTIAKEINDEYDLNPKKTAAILIYFLATVKSTLRCPSTINFEFCGKLDFFDLISNAFIIYSWLFANNSYLRWILTINFKSPVLAYLN
jgi:hypothetical protein